MAVVTLLDLVQNGTMNSHIGALLWTIAEEKRWMVTAAVPRKAGKTTVLDAALQFVPRDTPIHRLDGTLDEIVSLGTKPDEGYLFPGEISTEPPARYIWGERVTALFRALRRGFSLATTMHAVSVEDVFDQICRDNGIGDEDASKIQYVVYVERRGESEDSYSRRVAGVYEVAGVRNGKPDARLLHAWRASDDTFDRVGAPRLLSASPSTLAKRARLIRGLVDAGRTSYEDVTKAFGHSANKGPSFGLPG
jgi:hypothetical protein